MQRVLLLGLFALVFSACGSSSGNGQPPDPPAPVTPPAPPPPPEPTFEERLQEWADLDPNGCRAQTPGFEALGGWLKDNRTEIGDSRVWVGDTGELSDPTAHGAVVWRVFSTCAVRSDEDRYQNGTRAEGWAARRANGRDGILSLSGGGNRCRIENGVEICKTEYPEPGTWGEFPHTAEEIRNGVLHIEHDGHRDGQRILAIWGAGNDGIDTPTAHLYDGGFQLALQEWEKSLVIFTGGYGGSFADEEDKRNFNSGSSSCGDAAPLCLFAPWSFALNEGTSIATPQVAAALDAAWAVWPDMDILDLRNLAFDCAENQDPREGESSTERTYSYRNGRSFTSNTNPTWGHGILSLTCLFTPNGGLQNPITGNAISGGIFGPLAGPVTGASITGVDYTGRDFGYGFARPVARENFALASLAFGSRSNLRPVHASSRHHGVGYAQGAYGGRLWQSGALSVDLTAAGASGGYGGGALGAAVAWQVRKLTLRGGIATQPEGVGSLTGLRAFRAPSTVSAAITAAYAAPLSRGFSAHLQADHWRTLATRGRSLWEGAAVRESRLTAALVKRAGAHEFALQGFWRSGLSGSLAVNAHSWKLTPRSEYGLWLTWRRSSWAWSGE